jgi:hypothetical protein
VTAQAIAKTHQVTTSISMITTMIMAKAKKTNTIKY